MAVKNSNYGVFKQVFQCVNCGRNSVTLGYGGTELIEYDDTTTEPDEDVEFSDSIYATCQKCGWVET